MKNQDFIIKLSDRLNSAKKYHHKFRIFVCEHKEDDLLIIQNENTGNFEVSCRTDYKTFYQINFGETSFYEIVFIVNCMRAILEEMEGGE